MKILTLLEGTIQVPDSTYNQLMAAVCGEVFSRILTYLDTPAAEDYFDSVLKYKNLAREYRKLYGDFVINTNHPLNSEGHAKVYVRMDELDSRYLKRNPNAKGRIYTIRVRISVHGKYNVPAGSYSKKGGSKAAELVVEMPSQRTLERVAQSPEMFGALMTKLEGTAEHELMHAIQDMAFKELPDHPAYYIKDKDGNPAENEDGSEKIDMDKYYNTGFEFSPQVITNAKNFIAIIAELRMQDYDVDANKKKLLLNFVNPSSPPPEGFSSNTSEFFTALKKVSVPRWKKAVKYFYGLVRSEF